MTTQTTQEHLPAPNGAPQTESNNTDSQLHLIHQPAATASIPDALPVSDNPPSVGLPSTGQSAQGPAIEIVQLTAEIAQLGAEAQRLVAESEIDSEPSAALLPAAGQPAVEAKAGMVRQLARLQRLQEEITSRNERLDKLMRAQLAAAYQTLGPLQEQAKRLQEGITAFSLYLGIEEGIETLRDGEPAPADTPVALRQMILSADQECMVAAESGGLDVEGWMISSPGCWPTTRTWTRSYPNPRASWHWYRLAPSVATGTTPGSTRR